MKNPNCPESSSEDKQVIHPRMRRERKTMKAMITIYCRAHHNTTNALCDDCEQLYSYSKFRLGLCPYQEEKPTCGNCTIHCYKSDMREKARKIMRFAGPRMTWRHPIMALFHLLDGFRKPPEFPKKEKAAKKN